MLGKCYHKFIWYTNYVCGLCRYSDVDTQKGKCLNYMRETDFAYKTEEGSKACLISNISSINDYLIYKVSK